MPSNNIKPDKYIGNWFVSSIGQLLSGHLLIDKINFSQTLILYSKVDFDGISFLDGKPNLQSYSTICGNCSRNNKITLFDCSFAGASPISEDLYEYKFIPSFSLQGADFIYRDQTKFSELTCKFPYFRSWFDFERNFFGSNDHVYDSENCPKNDYRNELLENVKPSLNQEELSNEIKIDDDFSIVIVRYYHDDIWSLKNEAKIEINHFVIFKSLSGKTFDDLKKIAFNFMQLMQLSTGKLIYTNFLSAISKKDDLNIISENISSSQENNHIIITNYNNINERNFIKSDDTDARHMLFYGGYDRSIKLKNIIKNWYKTIDKYSPIYNIFLDTFEWFQNTDAILTHIMFHNRFVNLVQAIERYHKFSYPEMEYENKEDIEAKKKEILEQISNLENRKWLSDSIKRRHISLQRRIEFILDQKLKEISSILFTTKENMESQVSEIIKLRNKLSHGERIEKESSVIIDYYRKTLIILLSCILLNLGLSYTEIKDAILHTEKYSDMLRYIKSKS